MFCGIAIVHVTIRPSLPLLLWRAHAIKSSSSTVASQTSSNSDVSASTVANPAERYNGVLYGSMIARDGTIGTPLGLYSPTANNVPSSGLKTSTGELPPQLGLQVTASRPPPAVIDAGYG